MSKIKSLSDNTDIKNKRIIVRLDFNVPIINKLIQDSFPNLTPEEFKTMLKTTNPSTEWSF